MENGESLLYLCTRFRERGREGKRLNEGPEKKFEKKLEKFGEWKTSITFAAAFERGDGREDREREKTRGKEFFKILRWTKRSERESESTVVEIHEHMTLPDKISERLF